MSSQCYLASAIDISHPSKGFKLYARQIICFISVWIICKFQEIKICLQTHIQKLDFKLKVLMKSLPRDAIFCNEFKVHYIFIWTISSAFHTMLLIPWPPINWFKFVDILTKFWNNGRVSNNHFFNSHNKETNNNNIIIIIIIKIK
jgi:hypothetical protein